MNKTKDCLKSGSGIMTVVLGLVIVLAVVVQAGDPYSAYYSSANDRIFWFIHFSDIHIGTSGS